MDKVILYSVEVTFEPAPAFVEDSCGGIMPSLKFNCGIGKKRFTIGVPVFLKLMQTDKPNYPEAYSKLFADTAVKWINNRKDDIGEADTSEFHTIALSVLPEMIRHAVELKTYKREAGE